MPTYHAVGTMALHALPTQVVHLPFFQVRAHSNEALQQIAQQLCERAGMDYMYYEEVTP